MGRHKKTVKHAGIIAEIEEEDLNEIRIVDTRQKTQLQPPQEKYWTANSIEAEKIADSGVKLIGVFSAFQGLPKRWTFDITKSELLAKGVING